MILCVMQGYNGLELMVYGAVELGDVVLFFIGEQGLFGLEVYARLVGKRIEYVTVAYLRLACIRLR